VGGTPLALIVVSLLVAAPPARVSSGVRGYEHDGVDVGCLFTKSSDSGAQQGAWMLAALFISWSASRACQRSSSALYYGWFVFLASGRMCYL
jgi:hypothetical protein